MCIFIPMDYRKLRTTLIIFLLGMASGYSQGIKIEKFQQEDGLPNDLIKSLSLDNKGYLWIATDDGIVKAQGRNFLPVIAPQGFTNNFKQLLYTSDTSFYVTADKGILKITETYDSIYAERLKIDKTPAGFKGFFYPKTIYQHTKGDLWIADLQSIYKLTGQQLSQYKMAPKNHADHFSRSYRFFEMGAQLYALSQPGYLYRFNPDKNEFDEVMYPGNGLETFTHAVLNDTTLLIGNKQGLLQLIFSQEGSLIKNTRTLKFNNPVSAIAVSGQNRIIIGTWGFGAYELNPDSTFTLVIETENSTINDILFDLNGTIWLASNEGLLQVHQTPFSTPFAKVTQNYIQDIQIAKNHLLYFSDGQTVWEVNRDTRQITPFFTNANGLILKIASTTNGLYISTNNGHIYYKTFLGKISKADYSDAGDGIYNLVFDHEDQLWFIQSQPDKQAVKRLNKQGELMDLTPDISLGENNVRSLKLMPNGKLLMGANGNSAYLYEFNYQTQVFENISQPLPFISNHTMGVVDMAYDKNNLLHIATSMGVWQVFTDTIIQLNLGKYNNELCTSIAFDSENKLWFANSNGIIVYNNGIEMLFNNNDGLPAKTINYRSLVIDEHDRVYAGTISGLALSTIELKGNTTPMPQIWSCNYSGIAVNPFEQTRFIANNILNFQLSCPVYPSKYTQYCYKLTPGPDKWACLERGKDLIVFSALKPGSYTLQIKAKYHGYFDWSQPYEHNFKVQRAWYLRGQFLIPFYFIILLTVYFYILLIKNRNERERRKLENIIAERTKTLQDRNEELTTLNQQLEIANLQAERAIKSKDRFFSILAHDLKSAFNTLIGFSQLLVSNRDELSAQDTKVLLGEMLNTSENTYKLLQNLLDWARTQTGSLKISPECIAVSEIIQEVLNIIEPAARQKRIIIIVNNNQNFNWIADVAIAATVLRNILTNAIKFSFPGSKINIETEIIDNTGHLHIIDYGVGISREKLNGLFSIDTNISTKGTTDEKGTGLGLVLCKELIEKSAGKITVESHVGLGSRFSIALPLHSKQVKVQPTTN